MKRHAPTLTATSAVPVGPAQQRLSQGMQTDAGQRGKPRAEACLRSQG